MVDEPAGRSRGGGGERFPLAARALQGIGRPKLAPAAAPKGLLKELVNAVKRWEKTAGGIAPEGYFLLDDVRPTKLLKAGARGDAVTALQGALDKAGHVVASTGVFDEQTEQAVRALQRSAAIVEDGILSASTLTALDRALGLPPRERHGLPEAALPTGLPPTGNAFLDGLAPGAVRGMWETRYPASVAIAQAVLESAWGERPLARDFKNLFGLVADQTTTSRRYENHADSVLDFIRVFAATERYGPVLLLADFPDRFARALTGTYSDDPRYGDTLCRIMRQYDLYRFDHVRPVP